jgi:hypothetical protein
MEANTLAHGELEKWLQGFVHVSALLKKENAEHPFLKRLPDSTFKMVEEEYEKINKGEALPDSDVGASDSAVADK